ncbi:MAG: mannose-1-phosphate guanylyltransferase [Spirochaetota bacterium]
MLYAVILAGGSGKRLWPMSTQDLPKQLLPLVNGKSLLEIAFQRLDGLVEKGNRFICAGEAQRNIILKRLSGFKAEQFLGEPEGRDTLAALAYSSAVIRKKEPEAVIAVFTSDHIIEPVDEFLSIVRNGYEIVEKEPDTLVTFGIKADYPATGFGYLELGNDFLLGSKVVKRFKEKPDAETATRYLKAGSGRYLWNSGMFIWKAGTFLDCVKKYEPGVYEGIMKISDSWGAEDQANVLTALYPGLKKISVDFAVMEPASKDPGVKIVALPMFLNWLDIGSWPAYAEICKPDENGNTWQGGKCLLLDSRNTLVVSDNPNYLIAGIGCDDLIIVHTGQATLVCKKDRAEDIKKLHDLVGEQFGEDYV